MSLDDRIALWWRLRNDPDFEPSWLRTMGAQPPKAEGEHREWADGGGDVREHIIVATSYTDMPMWTTCRCGETVRAVTSASLARRWDTHRGLTPEQVMQNSMDRYGERATDEDVLAFLVSAANPNYAYGGD